MKISKESSGINLVDSENSIIIWIFRVVSLFSYQGSALSLYRVSKIYYIKSLWPCQHFFLFSFCFFIASTNIILSNPFGFVKSFFYFFRVFSTFVLSRGNPAFFHKIFFAVFTGCSLDFKLSFTVVSSKYHPPPGKAIPGRKKHTAVLIILPSLFLTVWLSRQPLMTVEYRHHTSWISQDILLKPILLP